MKTLLTNSVTKAASYIKKGKIAAFPTETVYGLGANAYDEKAAKKIFKAKGRPSDNPLIVHVANKMDINVLAAEIQLFAKKIIRKFFPGPVTVILKKNEIIPGIITGGLDTVAIRMPSSKMAREFINLCGVPVAAPSANISGSPSPTTFIHVLMDFNGKIPCILIGPAAKYGLESTVIDCSGAHPVILRPGIVTLEQIRKIDKNAKVLVKSGKIKSPGTRYKHYSPKAKVRLVSGISSNAPKLKSGYIGFKKPPPGFYTEVKICKSVADYARNIFAFFRKCDEKGLKLIYCQKVSENGIGLAIMNRLKKAAR